MSLIIICDRPGRLGNLLLVFSHFAAFAIEHNVGIINPAFAPYKHYFRNTCHQHVACFNVNGSIFHATINYKSANYTFRLLRLLSFCIPHVFRCVSLDWSETLDLDITSNLSCFDNRVTLVGGWLFRCNSLVEKHKPQLAEFFQPLDKFKREAENIVAQARKYCSSQTLIGIHVRRGDYASFEGGKYYYPLSLYRSFIKFISCRSTVKLGFILVSDEPLSMADFAGLNVFISSSSEIVDMVLLSMCDGVIGPPSTFSYFASSILGNGNLFHIQSINQQVPASFLSSFSNNH